ncbi:MAG: hypothetical protein JXR78_17455 [Victivallales bacterium]|nr:hypothetical protein [Victivallales bacterium]
MDIFADVINTHVNFQSERSGVHRLRVISVKQYCICNKLAEILRTYLHEPEQELLFMLDAALNILKQDVTAYLPPESISLNSEINSMDIPEMLDFMSRLFPVCACRVFDTDIAFAAGRIMTRFGKYDLAALLDMPVTEFSALLTLAEKMQADEALELHLAASNAFHHADASELKRKRGAITSEVGAFNQPRDMSPDDYQAARKLALEITHKHITTVKEN